MVQWRICFRWVDDRPYDIEIVIITDKNEDMIKNGMRPIHPGKILREELEELGMSAKALARELGVSQNRISDILRGRRGITADTALQLAYYLNTTSQLWLNLQKTRVE